MEKPATSSALEFVCKQYRVSGGFGHRPRKDAVINPMPWQFRGLPQKQGYRFLLGLCRSKGNIRELDNARGFRLWSLAFGTHEFQVSALPVYRLRALHQKGQRFAVPLHLCHLYLGRILVCCLTEHIFS